MLTDAGRIGLGRRLWISDTATAALVGPDGTLDWLAPVQPAAAPRLGRLLDPGWAAVRVGPVRESTRAHRTAPPGAQAYRPGTLVAETRIDAPDGRVLVTDALAWPDRPGRVIRLATALSGPVEVEVEVLPPSGVARVDTWSEGVRWPGAVVHCGIRPVAEPLGPDRARWRARRWLTEGESMVVTVDDPTAIGDPLTVDGARRLLDATAAAWRATLAALVHDGPDRAVVERAVLVVLGSSPDGGPVSAATTSLPRLVGGERNDEGRVVRLRHAAGAAGTLAAFGLVEAAEAAETWLRQAVADLPLPWPPALGPDGGPAPEEEPWTAAGWRGSAPVVGGVPGGIVDLDVLGDVLPAVSVCRTGPAGQGGDGPLVAALPALAAAADWAVDHLAAGDAGVWGRRGEPVRSTATAVQLWAGLDDLVRRTRSRTPLDLAVVPWHDAARSLVAWAEQDCVVPGPSLRAGPDGDGTDAALLRLAWRGPWPPAHPLVGGTVARVLERLGSGPLVHRLSEDVGDGRPGADPPDVEASYWAVRALARLGRWEEAHERFEAVTALAGAGGLLGEAADPRSGELLGNRPAVGAHLALLDAALELARGPR